jgi:hypothetical protein
MKSKASSLGASLLCLLLAPALQAASAASPAASCSTAVSIKNDLYAVRQGELIRLTSDGLPKVTFDPSPSGDKALYVRSDSPAKVFLTIGGATTEYVPPDHRVPGNDGLRSAAPILGARWQTENSLRIETREGKDTSKFSFLAVDDGRTPVVSESDRSGYGVDCDLSPENGKVACVDDSSALSIDGVFVYHEPLDRYASLVEKVPLNRGGRVFANRYPDVVADIIGLDGEKVGLRFNTAGNPEAWLDANASFAVLTGDGSHLIFAPARATAKLSDEMTIWHAANLPSNTSLSVAWAPGGKNIVVLQDRHLVVLAPSGDHAWREVGLVELDTSVHARSIKKVSADAVYLTAADGFWAVPFDVASGMLSGSPHPLSVDSIAGVRKGNSFQSWNCH